MKTVGIITSTRAEFGLLMPVVNELKKYQNNDFSIELIVTGTHLKKEFGYTINEIIEVGLIPDIKIEIPVDNKNPSDISNNQAITIKKFTNLFLNKRYNGITILGDRYEMLAIAIAAGNTHTPIFHLCGGDTTEGALDEWIRHSITKMSYLHFPSNEISYRRIIQLGESPERVFNYGSTSIDNILNRANMSKVDVLKSIGLYDCMYAICTYHPVKMENNDINKQVNEFIESIKEFPHIQFIITKSNADQGGTKINKILDKANDEIKNCHVFTSLGVVKYLSLMRYAEFVLGNSSSGIIEAPIFKIPTINIGDRQRGRLQSKSIINCLEDKGSIVKSINIALSSEFKAICSQVVSPYGDGHAAEQIAKKIYDIVIEDKINLKKEFYEIGEKI